jgi:choline-sulfatase
MSRISFMIAAVIVVAACRSPAAPAPARDLTAPRNLVIVTIDTLRADRVGAYGYQQARTPVMDDLAQRGARFIDAIATAPITLTSHASLLTGRYPPGHGARHNGIAAAAEVPTLAEVLRSRGWSTAAFVSAFPLDRRFGLARGFETYDDELPRAQNGQPLNERSGLDTARRATEWLTAHATQPFFLWLHLFEPHAPYGSSASGTAASRYDAEVAIADEAVGRLMSALGREADRTLVIVTADHGEAFGEHGEIGHSIFVYDTTLRVPLLMRGPGVPAGLSFDVPVSLVDVAPTVAAMFGIEGFDADGVSLKAALGGGAVADRTLYAESFAPLLDFGWSALRTIREGDWKYIDAPRAELYDLARDRAESSNRIADDAPRAARLQTRLESYGGRETPRPAADAEATRRLRTLGYVSGGGGTRDAGSGRPDPKDRIEVASRLAMVMAGEVAAAELIPTLEAILRDDPGNPQAHLRLGFAELAAGRCARAEPHLRRALEARIPSADAGLGIGQCRSAAGDHAGASRALEAALALEPGNPVVLANLGLMALARKDDAAGIAYLEKALTIDRNLYQARFELARSLARVGRVPQAREQAETLLSQLPADAPQRSEVERLVATLRSSLR